MASPELSKPLFSPNTQYVGVTTYNDEPSPGLAADYYQQYPSGAGQPDEKIDLQSHPQLKGRRSWIKTFIIQTFSLLWVVPMGALLYLNIKGQILGASAWCLGGKCFPEVFNPTTSIPQLLMAKHDKENHNLLGALQLAAKALEVWFILICSWLIYLITMFLASRQAGLPIAYITRPNEFADLSGLIDPLLWRSLPKFHKTGQRKARKRVWIFVLFTVVLGLICNLMGPATAVLILPTLQWLTTDRMEPTVFNEINSRSPPSPNGFIWNYAPNCDTDMINSGLYSCLATPWSTTMDSWISSYIASGFIYNGITQQDQLSFNFNSTGWADESGAISDWINWAPSRQVMQLLSEDLRAVSNISKGGSKEDFAGLNLSGDYDSYVPLNNTVQTFIQRQAPVLGVASNMWVGYDNQTWWDSMIEDNKFVRCFNNYDAYNTPLSRGVLTGSYTKCVKWGDGWNNDFKAQWFTVEGQYRPTLDAVGPSAYFAIWTSDTAAYLLNGTPPEGFSSDCLPVNDVVAPGLNCDWDAFFTPDPNSPMYSRSFLTNQIQIISNFANATGHPSTITFLFDFVAYLNFTTYEFDPSPISNPLWLATTPDLPMSGKPLYVDPAWTVAAWSSDVGGSIGANRSATLELLKMIDYFWRDDVFASENPLRYTYDTLSYLNADYLALLPIIQTLSLIEWTAVNQSANPSAVTEDHPLFTRGARINVWAYGLSGRTSYVGIAVAGIGLLVVLFQVFLGVTDRRPYRSPTELLVAALEHSPSAEFLGKEHDERAIAKVPFRVEDLGTQRARAGKFRFDKSL